MNSGVSITVRRTAKDEYRVRIIGGTDARRTPYAFAWRHDRYAQVEGRRISFQHSRIILRLIVAMRKNGDKEMSWSIESAKNTLPHRIIPNDAIVREEVYKKMGVVE